MFAGAYMGRKRCFQMLSVHCTRILALGRCFFCYLTEALEGAAPIFFGPCTLWRTWGTRPGARASVFLNRLEGILSLYFCFIHAFHDLRSK
jgi:hypothetical protein